MDGYSEDPRDNYVEDMAILNGYDTSVELNEAIYKMLKEFIINRESKNSVWFVTKSRFATEELSEIGGRC